MRSEIRHHVLHAFLYATEIDDEDPRPLRTALVRAVTDGVDLTGADLSGADLSGADLSRARLARAWFARADLAGVDLSSADLCGSSFVEAHLTCADLSGADLSGARVVRTNLVETSLASANLTRVSFHGSSLIGANLARAHLDRTDLTDADLSLACLADTNIGLAHRIGAHGLSSGSSTAPPGPHIRVPTRELRQERAARYRSMCPEVPAVARLDARILEAVTTGGGALTTGGGALEMTGWVIILAGRAGRLLEHKYGTQHAGTMIYYASTGRVPHFHAVNKDALADIRAWAAES